MSAAMGVARCGFLKIDDGLNDLPRFLRRRRVVEIHELMAVVPFR
mgnify:CR=1 FL=1